MIIDSETAYTSLSRIGRRYPHTQNIILPTFEKDFPVSHFLSDITIMSSVHVVTICRDILMTDVQDPKLMPGSVWAILIGWGRMSQSNPQLRSTISEKLYKSTYNADFRLRYSFMMTINFYTKDDHYMKEIEIERI